MKFLDFLLKSFTLFSKINSKNWFWYNVSLGWKSANYPISVLNTLGVVLLGNIGSEPYHPFGLLIRILATVSGLRLTAEKREGGAGGWGSKHHTV